MEAFAAQNGVEYGLLESATTIALRITAANVRFA
jgi:hypothetical protein